MFRLLGRIVQNYDSGNYRIKFRQNNVRWYIFKITLSILKTTSGAFTGHEQCTNNDFSFLFTVKTFFREDYFLGTNVFLLTSVPICPSTLFNKTFIAIFFRLVVERF